MLDLNCCGGMPTSVGISKPLVFDGVAIEGNVLKAQQSSDESGLNGAVIRIQSTRKRTAKPVEGISSIATMSTTEGVSSPKLN